MDARNTLPYARDLHWDIRGAASPETNEPGLTMRHLLRAFDEIDYGMIVLNASGHILHSNHLARVELGRRDFLRACDGVLSSGDPAHDTKIRLALEAALRGQRRLVLLTQGERDLSLTFNPLAHPLEDTSPCVLVMLSRQSTCDNLAVRMFARTLALSPSEEGVMLALCRGLVINEIAQENGVAVSTVRSQIKTLREKAGVPSIRKLLQRINSLPPVVPALRIVTPVPQNPRLDA